MFIVDAKQVILWPITEAVSDGAENVWSGSKQLKSPQVHRAGDGRPWPKRLVGGEGARASVVKGGLSVVEGARREG
ncbi:hypothetical protein [Streptomyces sp. NPDC088358]|uniref:hypothetical protein n=1 Tax=Streptomyces sp. NPDC088358 TaxID=3365857 RepID=UPI00380A48F0